MDSTLRARRPVKAVPLSDLKDKVEIQARGETNDGMGGKTVTWSSLGNAWASVVRLSANAEYVAKKADVEISHAVFIRFLDGIKRGDRVVYCNAGGERQLEIQSVFELDTKRIMLRLDCLENTP